MSWKPEIEELKKRQESARRLGGEDSIAYQHRLGKFTVRERIEKLLDKNSFQEMGMIAGSAEYDRQGKLEKFTPSNAVIGKGLIEGRKVTISADDFTIRGGSSESTISEKWLYAERYSYEMQTPMVRLVDTAGGSVRLLEQSGATKIPGYPSWPIMQQLGTIPIVGVAMGSCAGLGAVKVCASHFSVMVKGTSQVFAAGPPVVRAASGDEIDKEELGGWKIQTGENGAVQNAAEDELDAIDQTRRFLSYMPRNVYETPPRGAVTDDPDRREEALLSIVPRNKRHVYKARDILEMVFDKNSVFELGRLNGPSTITCLARLDGYTVGVMANDVYSTGGALTRSAASKIEKFVDVCDTFHIPVVNFTDQPGVMLGLEAEKSGTFRSVLKALGAIEQSRVPWISIMVRRAFGVGGGLHGRKNSINLRYAWPSGYWGSIPLEGGILAAYRKDIEASEDPKARLQELEEYYTQFTSPFKTAEKFGIMDIIDPRETRPILCEWIGEAFEVTMTQLGARQLTMRA
ncbi:MAG: carboxyl transferase domain-containing protein [Candidatus Adiutricales bacterium]